MLKEKIKTVAKVGGGTLFGGLVLSVIGLNIVLSLFFFVNKEGSTSRKKVLFAGYASGTMIDYRLEVYEDSTYFLSTTNFEEQHKWVFSEDTLFFKQRGKVCAKIVNETLIDCLCKDHSMLRIMQLKEFLPAQIITYPKND